MQRFERIHTAKDGWQLNTLELLPSTTPHATAICGHAMMVDRRTLYRRNRPSLVRTLLAAGFRVLVPDLRGHGRSGPLASQGGSWTYDDLVADTETYLSLAKEGPGSERVVLLGHSLFGHTSLAYMLRHPDAPVEAFVALGVAIWNRRFNRGGPVRWMAKASLMELCTLMGRTVGYVPAVRTGFGSVDEPWSYWRRLADCVRHDRWLGPDGIDLYPSMHRMQRPFLHVVSTDDRWFAQPEEALAFSDRLPERAVLWVGRGGTHPELTGLSLDHMTMVTNTQAQPVWDTINRWLLQQLRTERCCIRLPWGRVGQN